jgi:hypothetical protein
VTADSAKADFDARCDVVEEAYEFLLAYASQGLASEEESGSGRQAREYLGRCDTALANLGTFLTDMVDRFGLEPAAPYHAFIAVMDRDARDAQAAVQLVLAQASISSQLVDNLNASIHLRALLTDLFLFDDVLKAQARS